jgi:hypothetical protein
VGVGQNIPLMDGDQPAVTGRETCDENGAEFGLQPI